MTPSAAASDWGGSRSIDGREIAWVERITEIEIRDGVGVEVGIWVGVYGYINRRGPVTIDPDILGTIPGPETWGASVAGGLGGGAGSLSGGWRLGMELGGDSSKEEEG